MTNNTTIKSLKRAALTFAAANLLLVGASQAADKKYDFEFTNVVDSTQGFNGFETFPAINNKGAVVFVAVQTGVGQGVFRSQDGVVTTIATVKDDLQFFGIDPVINVSGVVAFGASTSSGSRAIFTSDGVSRRLIVDSTVTGLFKNGVGSPSRSD